MVRGWRAHEQYVADLFGLDLTLTSGNKFFDPGDAVSRTPHDPFPLYADAKYTEAGSYTLKLKELLDYQERAMGLGKHLILPVRFWSKDRHQPEDFVVLELHDLQDLIERTRRHD